MPNTWLAEKGALPAGADDRIIANTLSTANYHCVDIQAQIKEQEAMFPGDLQVNWMFYSNTIDYTPWSEYAEYFGFEPSSATLSLSTLSGGYLATATCLDCGPCPTTSHVSLTPRSTKPTSLRSCCGFQVLTPLVRPFDWAAERKKMAACCPSSPVNPAQVRVHLHRREGHVRDSGRASERGPTCW